MISVSSSLKDWLARLQREGYENKLGKYVSANYIGAPAKSYDFVGEGGATKRVSFLPQGQNERYAVRGYAQERLKTLAADYTEETVISRIAGGPRPSRLPRQRSGKVSLH